MVRFRLIVEAVDDDKQFKEIESQVEAKSSDVICDDCYVIVHNMNNHAAISAAEDLISLLSAFSS